MRFEWDPAKNKANRKKHSVGFEEAEELLESEDDFLEIYDDSHSVDEERFISVGPVRGRLIVVVWTERGEDTSRIISARLATKREKELYREHMEVK